MIWLAWKLLTLPVRLVVLALRIVFGTIRVVGPGRIVAFGAGVATGLAAAPTDGRALRARVLGPTTPPVAGTADVAAAVRTELANSPRTWHLPQPAVRVADGRVELRGAIPHEEARLDLVRTAGAVHGVRAVDDQLVVRATDIPG